MFFHAQKALKSFSVGALLQTHLELIHLITLDPLVGWVMITLDPLVSWDPFFTNRRLWHLNVGALPCVTLAPNPGNAPVITCVAYHLISISLFTWHSALQTPRGVE